MDEIGLVGFQRLRDRVSVKRAVGAMEVMPPSVQSKCEGEEELKSLLPASEAG